VLREDYRADPPETTTSAARTNRSLSR
jgi:hypothetical protein